MKAGPRLYVFVLPAALVEALPCGARVVEVGVGGRFDVLEALRRARPDLTLVAVDRAPGTLEGAPGYVEARVADALDPDPGLYADAALVLATRPPADLQPALARLARSAGADLAVSPLGTELAPLDARLGEARVLQGDRAWYWWPATGRGEPP